MPRAPSRSRSAPSCAGHGAGPLGAVPAHLNELPPDEARGTFPGFVYLLGNLLAAINATLQAELALRFGGNYGLALTLVAGVVALVIAALTAAGVEAKGVSFGKLPGSRGPSPAVARPALTTGH